MTVVQEKLLRSAALMAGAFLTWSANAAGQSAIPIREMSPPEARSTESFGMILGVRPLDGGQVLVNDALRRQLIVLNDKFTTRTVSLDSAASDGQSYGPRATPLIPYLADSSLFVDGQSSTLLVIDSKGKVAHVMSAPKPGDLSSLASSASGVDAKGNLVYRGRFVIAPNMNGAGGRGGLPALQVPDSSPVVRADFDTRKVDTLGRVKVSSGNKAVLSQDANGKLVAKTIINPLNTVDEWAVLSDGTIVFVRGHDYHLDLIAPNGTRSSTDKLPFDWKRLTDEDKQALIDSAKTAIDKAVADAKSKAPNPAAAQRAGTEAAMVAMMSAMSGGSGMANVSIGGMGGRGAEIAVAGGAMTAGGAGMGGMGLMALAMPTIVTEFVPLNEIADYYPAIRPGAVKADLDGNLWVLPTSSAQSKAGELIYDIVSNQGKLTQRVRLPAGRAIAGFGHNGIVYLMERDANGNWFLERSRILNYTKAMH